MIQEDKKDLLLKDLCARLPYGVKVRINTKNNYYTAMVCEITRNYICVEGGGETCFSHGTYQLYLRPMSSITKDEEIEWYEDVVPTLDVDKQIDFYNKHHFDYRGLIEKGLALEATEDMYKN